MRDALMKDCLYIVTGPTAVGKTSLCLRIAEELVAEVVSCDSMQLYRGMDIGTAKATKEELDRVPHHCLDVLVVSEPGNVQKFQEMALCAVNDIRNRGKQVLVTGGSGFYLKSFLAPVVDDVKVPEDIRVKVEGLYQNLELEGLVEELMKVNPEGVGELDTKNPRRVVRALERCLTSGLTVFELQQRMKALPKPYPNLNKKVCILVRSDDLMKERIMERTHTMIESGFVSEVEELLLHGLGENLVARNAIGYREVIAYLNGELGRLEELSELIIQNTWQLVRKQKKWFRHQLPEAKVVDLDQCPEPTMEDLFGTDD